MTLVKWTWLGLAAGALVAKPAFAQVVTDPNDPQQAYPQQAYPQPAYPQQTYPQPAYPQQAYPQQAYPQPIRQAPAYQPVYPTQRRGFGYQPAGRPQFGIAGRFGGYGNYGSFGSYSTGGGGVDILFRALPRLTFELGFQYQHLSEEDLFMNGYQYDRYDVPITLGVRVYLGNPRWMLSPYIVGAAGATYSRLTLLEALTYESHWFGEVQGGVGLEWRLGPHFFFHFDLRGQGRFRKVGELGTPNSKEGTLTDEYGNTVPAMGSSGGFVLNIGLGGFF